MPRIHSLLQPKRSDSRARRLGVRVRVPLATVLLRRVLPLRLPVLLLTVGSRLRSHLKLADDELRGLTQIRHYGPDRSVRPVCQVTTFLSDPLQSAGGRSHRGGRLSADNAYRLRVTSTGGRIVTGEGRPLSMTVVSYLPDGSGGGPVAPQRGNDGVNGGTIAQPP